MTNEQIKKIHDNSKAYENCIVFYEPDNEYSKAYSRLELYRLFLWKFDELKNFIKSKLNTYEIQTQAETSFTITFRNKSIIDEILNEDKPNMSKMEEGYYDEVGGYHEAGTGTSPYGYECGECSKHSCENCPAYLDEVKIMENNEKDDNEHI